MFEDEMTERHMVRTAEHYYRVSQQERHAEKLALAMAYISALEGTIACLRHRLLADRAPAVDDKRTEFRPLNTTFRSGGG